MPACYDSVAYRDLEVLPAFVVWSHVMIAVITLPALLYTIVRGQNGSRLTAPAADFLFHGVMSASDRPVAVAPKPDAGNFRIVLEFARPHRRALTLGLVFAMVGAGATLATPLVTKSILDSLGSGASLWGPVALLGVLLVVGAFFGWGQWTVIGTAAESIVYDARESLIHRFFHATVPAIQNNTPGELVTRVTSDTVLLREAASGALVGVIRGVVVAIGTLALMAFLDIPLLGVAVGAIVVVGAVFAVLMPQISRAETRTQAALGRLGGALEGNIRAIRTVKVSGAEGIVSDRVSGDARDAKRHALRSVYVTATAWTIAGTGIQGAIIVILGFGAWRVDQGYLEVSTLIAFLLYSFTLMGPISELAQNITQLQSGIAAASRIRQMQALPLEQDRVPSEAGNPTAAAPLIQLTDVRLRYPDTDSDALNGIDLAIPRVGHTAIVGPSGAGKTSLLSLILRFLEPTDGELLLRGVPYPTMTHKDIRRTIACVEQETPALPGTIRENLLFTHPDASDADIAAVLDRIGLTDLVAQQAQGLDTPLIQTSLSGGQRQRIALARAIIGPTELLLLDEATAQVDAITEALIVDAVAERAATSAVLTVAHRLSTVQHADRIIVLEGGRVRAIGTHNDLAATDDLYHRLVEAATIDTVPAGS